MVFLLPFIRYKFQNIVNATIKGIANSFNTKGIVPMNVIRRLSIKNLHFQKADTDSLPEEAEMMISLPIRSGSPSNPGKSHRRKQTKLVMKQQCDGRKGIMLLLSQHMLIRHIFIIISFTIQPHLTAIINSEIFCFAALHFKG